MKFAIAYGGDTDEVEGVLWCLEGDEEGEGGGLVEGDACAFISLSLNVSGI